MSRLGSLFPDILLRPEHMAIRSHSTNKPSPTPTPQYAKTPLLPSSTLTVSSTRDLLHCQPSRHALIEGPYSLSQSALAAISAAQPPHQYLHLHPPSPIPIPSPCPRPSTRTQNPIFHVPTSSAAFVPTNEFVDRSHYQPLSTNPKITYYITSLHSRERHITIQAERRISTSTLHHTRKP